MILFSTQLSNEFHYFEMGHRDFCRYGFGDEAISVAEHKFIPGHRSVVLMFKLVLVFMPGDSTPESSVSSWSVHDCILHYVNMISYKLFTEISPDLQLKCSCE